MDPTTLNIIVQGGAFGLLTLVLLGLRPLLAGLTAAAQDAFKRQADSVERIEALLAKHDVDDERRAVELRDEIRRSRPDGAAAQ
jgi:hypothetical protein